MFHLKSSFRYQFCLDSLCNSAPYWVTSCHGAWSRGGWGGDNFLQTTIRVLNAFRRQKTSGTTASVCIFCVFCCNGNEFCSLSVRSSTSPRFRKNILLKSFEALTFVFQISFSMSEILCFYQIWNTVTCFAYNLNNLVGVFWSCRMRVIPER